ncbi:MAG: hypothetical protein Q4C72_02660 [Eubacteriales bacterium]|nr:hypothetical protein [Eubacteriales bacterium]
MKKALNILTTQPVWAQFAYEMVLTVILTAAAVLPIGLIAQCFYNVAGFILIAGIIALAVIVRGIHQRAAQSQLRLHHLYENAPRVLFQALSDAAMQIGALAPATFEDIFSPQGDCTLGTTTVMCFELFKSKSGIAVDPAQLIEYRSILQARINKLLCTGRYIWLPFADYCLLSALTILEVQDGGAMLYIHVALVYDDASRQSVLDYRNAATAVPSNGSTSKQVPAIPLALNKPLLDYGHKKPVLWPYDQAPHAVVIGSTGSGKTYFVKQTIWRALKHIPNAAVTVCDFKADDFRFLSGFAGYYQHIDCAVGLQAFVDLFTARQAGTDPCRDFRLLVFDEWASYLQSLDKKQADTEMKKLATLLMLGRSFGCHVLVSQQRGDAQYFSTARDNFGMVIALGNLSPESRDMFFKGYKDKIELTQEQGTGYAAVNGGEPIAIQVPTVDIGKVESAIQQHFTPTPPGGAGEA